MPKIVDREKQRRNIALAACRAIAHYGVDKTTMVDIAAEAGVTTGMITHYFNSKRDIVAATLRLVLGRMEQRMESCMPDGEDRLFSILKETLPIDTARRRECAVWVSFWGKVTTDRKLATVNRTLHEDAEELYARVIHAGWPDSRNWSAPVFDATHKSILVFLNGLTAGAVTSPQSWPVHAQFEALRLHLQLIRNRAEQSC